ncbi:hypothetical protein G4D72_05775 [Flavobacterium sp. KDG-16]|uniref:Lipoprotein n=1 Tax=Flavobacterium difficile TaxID=2709659 RepID=A0ABX0I633_9FLAO|nr:hypothetical protein [Flavobacterium difficile]
MRFFIAILFLSFLSCKEEKLKTPEFNIIEPSVSKSIKKREFPLKNVAKIEFLSYPDRIAWDTISYKGEIPFRKNLIENQKFTFDSTMIKERIVLNEIQKKELFALMVCDTCVPEEMAAACYQPRHLILFKDKKNKIVGYQEFCFQCIGLRESENLEGFEKFCFSDMNKLFRKFGIKYFVENDEDNQKEYHFLKNKGYIK